MLEARVYDGPMGVAELVLRGDIADVVAFVDRLAADCTRLAGVTA